VIGETLTGTILTGTILTGTILGPLNISSGSLSRKELLFLRIVLWF
jgi:hypothetical protein